MMDNFIANVSLLRGFRRRILKVGQYLMILLNIMACWLVCL